MAFCRNVSDSGVLPSEYPPDVIISPDCSKLESYTASLDDLFPIPTDNTDEDVGLEWLSIFVEDCLSSTGNCIPSPTHLQNNPISQPSKTSQKPHQIPPFLQECSIPSKARSKRKRPTTPLTTSFPLHAQEDQSLHLTTSSDPPLLHQAYWLADSELIVPKKENSISGHEEEKPEEKKMGKDNSGSLEGSIGQPRRCTHCLSQRTPQWRAGPLGRKTLCNACGVRFKSGRLLPEYRPAKSPTFVSYKHSNSHKKVMEMRMSTTLSSFPSQ